MRSVKMIVAAGAASLAWSSAMAADMPIAPPPAYAPPPAEEFGGWYLRGDIGMTNQSLKFQDTHPVRAPLSQDHGFSSASSTLFGLGLGYQINNWFRADVIGQYRGKAALNGATSIIYDPAQIISNSYTGNKSEWLVMANAYVDLGTWWCVTPFVGAGVGMANVRISGFQDNGIGYSFGNPILSATYFDDVSKWNFAWAAHAGLAYKVNPNLTLELAYSYVDMGSVATAGYRQYSGASGSTSFYKLNDITSHDLKLGVRWNFESAPVYAPPPPLIRKG